MSAVNETETVTAAAEVNEIVTVRDRGGGGERGGAVELDMAELVTSPTCRVHFGGVHGCGDDDAAAEEGTCLTAGTRAEELVTFSTCRVHFQKRPQV
jgi:hypothetical protein